MFGDSGRCCLLTVRLRWLLYSTTSTTRNTETALAFSRAYNKILNSVACLRRSTIAYWTEWVCLVILWSINWWLTGSTHPTHRLELSPVMRCMQKLLAVQLYMYRPLLTACNCALQLMVTAFVTLLCSQHRRVDSLQYDSLQYGGLIRLYMQCRHAPATGLNALLA